MKKVVIVTLLITLFGLASCDHHNEKNEHNEKGMMENEHMEKGMKEGKHNKKGMMEGNTTNDESMTNSGNSTDEMKEKESMKEDGINDEDGVKEEDGTNKEDSVMMNSKFMMNDTIGKEILVDDKGMTLYVFKNDTKNVSNCSGECEVKWPVYYNESLTDNGFSSIERADGKMQTAYNGYPLYYFFKDTKAGDTNGHNVKDVWFVVDKDVSFLNSVMDEKLEK